MRKIDTYSISLFFFLFFSFKGGFDGTSNVLAGKLFNIPVRGTHAHAYITSFSGLDDLKNVNLRHKSTGTSILHLIQKSYSFFDKKLRNVMDFIDFAGLVKNLLDLAVAHRQQLSGLLEVSPDESSDGELAAMVSFAIAFPDGFMALVDTYDVKRYFLLCSQVHMLHFHICYAF